MLSMKLLRENPDLVKASQRKRGKSEALVDEVLALDEQWRHAVKQVEKLKAKRNAVSKEINELKKKGADIKKKVEEMRRVAQQIKDGDDKAKELLVKRDDVRYKVGNILHESVPEGMEPIVVRTGGKKPTFKFELKSHVDLLEELDLADLRKAAEVAGARFYYLKNELVRLSLALQMFALNHLTKKGFMPVITPFFLNHQAMAASSELADFEEQLYKIEGEDLYLIATSEQPMVSYHMNETYHPDQLPLKYVCSSSCFRKETGSHGKDTKGIFRVHRFEKVEQIMVCKPDESWKWHEELIRNAEELFTLLGIHYRVVNIAAQDMNDNGAKKYDLEAWMPVGGTYREMVSCTNTTDYQSRKLNTKYEEDGARHHVHLLNCTGLAISRTMVAILENYQQKDGSVKVPDVLVPYMDGVKVIKRT